ALRYRLMPYLYSAAFRTCDAGEPMVLPMAVAFPSDPAARDFDVQYLFGGALLVSPVVVRGAEEKETYLPEGAWYDFYTGELLEGGRTVMRAAPQSLIPVYAKAGSIIPMAEDAPSTDRIDASRLRLRVYPGADCRFQLYEDDGESYACERGERMLTDIRWDEAGRVLTIEAARGQYRGNPERRSYVVEYPGGIVSLPEGDLRVARQVVLPRGETAPAAQPSIDYAIEMNELAPQRVVKIYLNNPYGAPLPARVRLTQPVGYEGGQRDAACEAAPGQTVVRIPLTMRGAQSASATLGIEVELGDVRAAFTESLNSGWATWWRLALPYAFEDDSGLDAELLPERTKRLTGASDVSVCAYEDHQCFGYVNLQSAMMRALPFDQLQGLRGARRVGYAACVAHVPEDASGFLLLMGEDRLRVFVDGRERMRVEDRFESPQRTGVALSAGEHRILVKAAQDGRSEWNDRAWGFYFAIADEAGKPIDGITYRMED
ncbi:MAG: DUF5110 domain-containing protein, partial [Clostridiales bacterium]|nr:DUF5110 domain-containing protein [Clostridiales bacterium]